jgi:hypothetical protein
LTAPNKSLHRLTGGFTGTCHVFLKKQTGSGFMNPTAGIVQYINKRHTNSAAGCTLATSFIAKVIVQEDCKKVCIEN